MDASKTFVLGAVIGNVMGIGSAIMMMGLLGSAWSDVLFGALATSALLLAAPIYTAVK